MTPRPRTSRRGVPAAAGALLAPLLAVLPAAPAAAQAAQAAQADPLRGLDAYIRQALAEWGGAGLSIAVVKDGAVVFARGYGVREAGKPEPVDESTLFAIGSNSKLFTAVLAGMMVDEGRMGWDDPATRHLPGFQLHDPYVTREIRLRDLLSHRSGLGRRGDLLWYGTEYDRAEILRRIRHLEPNSSFRSAYGYQNIMFLAAGEAIAAAAGKSWDALVAERIFAPLGMTTSTTTTRDLPSRPNVATPHAWADGRPVPVPHRNLDNIAPAGSIYSSAREMGEWLRLLLARGEHGGRRLLKTATLEEIETPHTLTGFRPDTLVPSTHFAAYGLGIGMRDYKGVKVLSHTGGIDGMLSLVTYVPERGLGLVVLTNTSPHNALYTALHYRVLDAYLGGPQRDWSRILLAQTREAEERQAAERRRIAGARVAGTRPSLPLGEYAGRYRNEMYGEAAVSEEGGGLVVRRGPALVGDAEHWHFDTFRAAWRGAGPGGETAFVTFRLGADGKVTGMSIEGVADFRRVPERAAANP